ncbi:unnamed protein product [Trichogramma brassicae]|uniref:Uncharacterized protein n=1 Tax=Trichogramma brassicae TaxID=86971 RepID=A0A6H5IS55_9HYME|nr:unnamed protein product [Trichogramma brassicae]
MPKSNTSKMNRSYATNIVSNNSCVSVCLYSRSVIYNFVISERNINETLFLNSINVGKTELTLKVGTIVKAGDKYKYEYFRCLTPLRPCSILYSSFKQKIKVIAKPYIHFKKRPSAIAWWHGVSFAAEIGVIGTEQGEIVFINLETGQQDDSSMCVEEIVNTFILLLLTVLHRQQPSVTFRSEFMPLTHPLEFNGDSDKVSELMAADEDSMIFTCGHQYLLSTYKSETVPRMEADLLALRSPLPSTAQLLGSILIQSHKPETLCPPCLTQVLKDATKSVDR